MDLSQVATVVIDEAGLMIKFKFQEAIDGILSSVPTAHQCIFLVRNDPQMSRSALETVLDRSLTD